MPATDLQRSIIERMEASVPRVPTRKRWRRVVDGAGAAMLFAALFSYVLTFPIIAGLFAFDRARHRRERRRFKARCESARAFVPALPTTRGVSLRSAVVPPASAGPAEVAEFCTNADRLTLIRASLTAFIAPRGKLLNVDDLTARSTCQGLALAARRGEALLGAAR